MKKVLSFMIVMLFMSLTDSHADNESFIDKIVVESIVQELNLKISNKETITDVLLESTCSDYASAIASFVSEMGGNYYQAWFQAFGVCTSESL